MYHLPSCQSYTWDSCCSYPSVCTRRNTCTSPCIRALYPWTHANRSVHGEVDQYMALKMWEPYFTCTRAVHKLLRQCKLKVNMEEIPAWFLDDCPQQTLFLSICKHFNHMATLGWSQREYKEHHLEVCGAIRRRKRYVSKFKWHYSHCRRLWLAVATLWASRHLPLKLPFRSQLINFIN